MTLEHRQPRVLVVDDEPQLVSVLSYALQKEGFEPIPAYDGRQALEVVRFQEVDLAVIDVMLPDRDGISLCAELGRVSDVPVIVLTAMSDQVDKIRGFTAGAADYITKPFSVEELILRVRAVLRRAKVHPRILQVGDLRIDSSLHDAAIEGQRIGLSPLEFDLLRHLATNKERVVSVPELLREVWRFAQQPAKDVAANGHLVKSVVYRLRLKLHAASLDRVTIDNVRGVGYRLVTE